jgi:hypothetical protein
MNTEDQERLKQSVNDIAAISILGELHLTSEQVKLLGVESP